MSTTTKPPVWYCDLCGTRTDDPDRDEWTWINLSNRTLRMHVCAECAAERDRSTREDYDL